MTELVVPARLAGGIAQTKYNFHKDGSTFLKRLRNVLGVSGKVSSNKAGDAVYGDVRLRTEAFEVVLLADDYADHAVAVKILYRKILTSGITEGTGPNQWTTLKEVEADPIAFLSKIRSL